MSGCGEEAVEVKNNDIWCYMSFKMLRFATIAKNDSKTNS